MQSNTIAAYSGGALPAAIGIVRISGSETARIFDGIFKLKSGKSITKCKTHTLYYGKLLDSGNLGIDICLGAFFRSPHSFTGEDSAEIYCHGSQAVVAAALEHCYALGARPAEAGEFTRRAFLNGRMDLTEAEASADLIYSKSKSAARQAVLSLEGGVSQKITDLRTKIVDVTAHFYAVCDYSDEDIAPFEYAHAQEALRLVQHELTLLYQGFERGRVVRDGLPVAVVGRPNAGKSSLFNALSGFDRAIVTDEPGTTRDIIEQTVICGDALIRLLDTAGIRVAESTAEKLGVEKAKSAAAEAAALIYVIDACQDGVDLDGELLSLAKAHQCAAVAINKTDILGDCESLKASISAMLPDAKIFLVSAINGDGIELLSSWLSSLAPDSGEVLCTSARQAALLRQTSDCLEDAIKSAALGMTADAFLSDAERAVSLLGQITGDTADADIAHEIFSRFCVGK